MIEVYKTRGLGSAVTNPLPWPRPPRPSEAAVIANPHLYEPQRASSDPASFAGNTDSMYNGFNARC